MNGFRQCLISLIIACLLLWQVPAYAIEQLKLDIGSWASQQLQGQQLHLQFHLTAKGLVLQGNAKRIVLPNALGTIRDVKLQCDRFELLSQQFSCQQGVLAFQHPKLGLQQWHFSLTAYPEQQTYRLKITGLNLDGAKTAVQIQWQAGKWQLFVNSPKMLLTQLRKVLDKWLSKRQVGYYQSWQTEGQLNVQAELTGNGKQLQQAKVNIKTKAINVSDSSGQHATESLQSTIHCELHRSADGWQWLWTMKVPTGQLYSEPVFIDFAKTPTEFSAKGKWQDQQQLLTVTQALLTQDKVLHVSFDGQAQAWQLQQLKLDADTADLNELYKVWLQPFLLNNALAKIDARGKARVNLRIDGSHYAMQTQLDNMSLEDESKRFGIKQLSGILGWTNDKKPLKTDLHWQQASIYAIPVGASQLKAQVSASHLELTDSLNLPILDGTLQINSFDLLKAPSQPLAWSFDGLLSPISMESLSQKLGWPLLHGKLSGVIPKVSYQQHQVKIDGALMVKLFGGTTVIRDLRLDSPFGALPQLYANIDMRGLDLQVLTQTFDFGKITGKLDGEVLNLRLSDWQPVQFDAEFATPDNDDSKHRISQRAINNLSQIGGGATGVLSRSFLRFFKNFSYKKLGVSCKLRNDVCLMSGINEAKQGYYLVKGGGLPPWIDVIGYTRRVDWKELIARLQAVSQSSGPVIE